MNYRKLGKTGLMVSEIGFGPEWMTGTPEETRAIAEVLREAGVNYLDCWMPDPHIRANLGYAMKGHTDEWIVQGHIGACWVDSIFAAVMWHWQNLPSKMSLHCSVLTTSK